MVLEPESLEAPPQTSVSVRRQQDGVENGHLTAGRYMLEQVASPDGR